MRQSVFSGPLVGSFFAALVAGIFYLIATPQATPADRPYYYLFIVNLILLIGAVVGTVRRKRDLWRVAIVMEGGIMLMVIIRIVFDSVFIDPQAHHLFPIEFVVALILTGPGCIVGVGVGGLILKLVGRKSESS